MVFFGGFFRLWVGWFFEGKGDGGLKEIFWMEFGGVGEHMA